MTKNQIRNGGNKEIQVKEVSEFSVSGDKLHQRIAEKAHDLYERPGLLPRSQFGGLARG